MDKKSEIVNNPIPPVNRPKPKYEGFHVIVSTSGRTVAINGYGEKPYWSDRNNCWMYETSYGLGGTSFGCIREIDILRIAEEGKYP